MGLILREQAVSRDLIALDELIEAGWGDVPQVHIPRNWRGLPAPPPTSDPRRIRLFVRQVTGKVDPPPVRKPRLPKRNWLA